MTDLRTALKGVKINRKKIYIDKSVFKALKNTQKELDSALNICEMAECCFDLFDFNNIKGEKYNVLDILKEKKENSQLLVREDIYDKLIKIRTATGVPVQSIMSYIIMVQLKNI